MLFKSLIGQSIAKSKLSFYLNGHKNGEALPFLMFTGAQGNGKTLFAREVAKKVKSNTDEKTKFVEVNCSILKNVNQFFDCLIIPLLSEDCDRITILFDEVHEIPKDVQNILLSIMNTEKGNRKTITRANGEEITFDFRKLTFLFATTDQQKLVKPLLDRMIIIDFVPYSYPELGRIIKMNVENCKFCNESLEEISKVARFNARNAALIAKDIKILLSDREDKSFTKKELGNLKKSLHIQPYGLNNSEVNVLKIIDNYSPCSLTKIAASTGLTAQVIRQTIEPYLMKIDAISIDSKRSVTMHGKQIIKSLI